jgi:hypothetical protein
MADASVRSSAGQYGVKRMKLSFDFPSFDTEFHELNQFILTLVDEYNNGKLKSWDALDEKVRAFYMSERMDYIESKAPGWKKMSSYSDGITLTHVTCVFLGMFMLSEFLSLSPERQQIAKWIILFHDIDKFHIQGKKDSMHAFHSAVIAAKELIKLGFSVTDKYHGLINSWSELTYNAFMANDGDTAPKPDNQKLPEILAGIDQLYGANTPATLIIKTVMLHISLNVDPQYPTPAPLTKAEIKRYINATLFPLLRVMMLSDSEGWTLFYPEVREQQNRDMLDAFERVDEIISK